MSKNQVVNGTNSVLTGDANMSQQADMSLVKSGFIFWNCFAVSLGFMQFGVGMSSWTNSQPAFAKQWDWSKDQETTLGDVCQSIIILGAAVGALSCAKFLAMGKLKLIYILNLILIVGVGISLIGQNIYIVCAGRFIWGIAFGAFSVVSAKFVNEIVPIELGGSFGAINQMALCFGSALPGTMALAYPDSFSDVSKDDFYVTTYWRIIWLLPLFVSALQILLLSTCFRHETPVFLQEKGREEELLVVMKKFYTGMEVRRRLDALQAGSQRNEGKQESQEVTIKETFLDPRIRGAAWVGFWLVTIQQLTGINAVIFYSAQLFGRDVDDPTSTGLSPNVVSCIINWANFLAAGIGAVLLGHFGRKTLFVGSQFFCIIGMIGMWIFSTYIISDTVMYVLVVAFIFGFEFGPGPIVWLYLSEICNDQATSVNTVVNWAWTLIVSISTPLLVKALNGYVWMLFGITCTLGFFYVLFMMKETKGVSKEKVKRLYYKDMGDEQQYDPID